MTECENAEIRDLLPDLAADVLSPVETARVRMHVESCAECSAELALLHTARSVRPRIGTIDIARIVSHLPKPPVAAEVDESVRSLDAYRANRRPAAARVSRSVWRVAATLGVIIAGGWSVYLVQSGGLALVAGGRADSSRLADVVERTALSGDTARAAVAAAAGSGVAVSFGDVGDYTDEELQRVLDRLDKWDGATSSEAVTTTPILAASRGGALE
jgi:hypothetical protein